MLTSARGEVCHAGKKLEPHVPYGIRARFAWENGKPDEETNNLLSHHSGTDNPPLWGVPADLIITKYKDPKKDGTYLEFVAKKKKAHKKSYWVHGVY